MTSHSGGSSPIMPFESMYSRQIPTIHASLQKLIVDLDEKINIGEKYKSEKKEFKKIEFYEKGSLLDFFSQGLSAQESKKSQQNLAPLNLPPPDYKTTSSLFRQKDQNSQNPILDFLGRCIPRQEKPSNNPQNPHVNILPRFINL